MRFFFLSKCGQASFHYATKAHSNRVFKTIDFKVPRASLLQVCKKAVLKNSNKADRNYRALWVARLQRHKVRRPLRWFHMFLIVAQIAWSLFSVLVHLHRDNAVLVSAPGSSSIAQSNDKFIKAFTSFCNHLLYQSEWKRSCLYALKTFTC